MKNKFIRLVLATVVILFIACGIYVNDYYHADYEIEIIFACFDKRTTTLYEMLWTEMMAAYET